MHVTVCMIRGKTKECIQCMEEIIACLQLQSLFKLIIRDTCGKHLIKWRMNSFDVKVDKMRKGKIKRLSISNDLLIYDDEIKDCAISCLSI